MTFDVSVPERQVRGSDLAQGDPDFDVFDPTEPMTASARSVAGGYEDWFSARRRFSLSQGNRLSVSVRIAALRPIPRRHLVSRSIRLFMALRRPRVAGRKPWAQAAPDQFQRSARKRVCGSRRAGSRTSVRLVDAQEPLAEGLCALNGTVGAESGLASSDAASVPSPDFTRKQELPALARNFGVLPVFG